MSNTIDRTPRTNETREKTARQVSFKPAHDLPTPTPRDGYSYRWIRVSSMGEADHANMARSRREGWEPCKAEDYPEFASDYSAFGLQSTGLIEIGGLVLCATSVEMAESRRQYYDTMTQRQTESVDNHFMSQSDPRAPLIREHKTRVSFGNG